MILPVHQSQKTTDLFWVPINEFELLRILCKENHPVCILLCLASFTQQNYSEIQTSCGMYQLFITFYCCVVNALIVWIIPTFCLPINLLMDTWIVSRF